MSLSPENQTFVSQLRFRMKPGHPEPPSLDEMKKAILLLRDSRRAAADANAASATKSRAKKAPPTAAAVADALADLDAM